mmetsp:Transcript_5345/g.13730  ORF Transcript_5345/g.13730 Transcript_5345/m.13730 type:complete len:400 (+) Transcript_5345:188-1387(+)|eukprot:CAMPEP_0202067428 /NCGR_PEP_ID=MMETSP0963-20130614/54475_1 /ASSEMBLY_ACC=CAM_ASM_000494 /TAXON_ID=4773 /ORGANISM="Schizochytrium aggregatum, Strain ATCC28209" /LENGTH=399 /DNA_ID=CAMNT_0048634143 /DNA_START=91 /DNA_END=1290 /DNA_ORIENTATION=+
MVLRGTAIAPPSLNEAEAALRNAEEILQRAKQELEEAKSAAFLKLDDEENLQNLTRDELLELVHKLNSKVTNLEQREQKAEQTYLKTQEQLQKTITSFACGGAAGAIARSTVAPIDRIKILMQTSHLQGTEGKYRSILGTARHIVQDEGLFRLWRGNLTNCIRVVPHTAIQFSSYDQFKYLLVGESNQMDVPTRLTAGALSGMTAATFTHPMDVVRIRLQTQPELRGMADATRSVFAENGMRSFYKGYTPAMLSLSPFIAINFATFDSLKTWYFGDRKFTKKELQQRSPVAILVLGATAGIFAQTACYPLDTVRRRMQLAGKHYTSTANAFTTIARDEGFRGFYKGMSANALKVVPNNAIRFAAYEVLKSYFMSDEAIKRTTAWRSQRRASQVPKPAAA